MTDDGFARNRAAAAIPEPATADAADAVGVADVAGVAGVGVAVAAPGRRVDYAAVGEADFDALAELRIAAMRESLERVGRFDPERARQRLRATYAPTDTWAILLEGVRVGFYTLRRDDGALKLDHLYILPGFQGQGLGAAVLARVFEQADALGMPVRVGALRDSASNRFYQRHGFVQTGEDAWDIYYERAAGAGPLR